MRDVLARHDQIVRGAIEGHGGYVFATGGDGFAAAFGRAGDAVAAAVEAQGVLNAEGWPEGAAIRVRMALHTGEAVEREGDYFGPAVNRGARLMALANGGQVLCSSLTAELAQLDVPLTDLGEHRLRDLSAPQRVFQVGEGRFPPLRSVDAVPTNLPTARNELIGRSADVTALAALAAHERLLTLTGVGGVGKTRLAFAVAAALAPSFPDGCWLAELAAVGDGGEVAPAVASAVRAPVTELDALVRYLSDRRAMIVLDNCEHVLDAACELTDALLASGPDVHVLATSREALGVDGEIVRRVQSLGLPSSGASAAEAGASAAVHLFVERASAVREGFALDATTVAPIAEICRHLDGIPLAIELAAARVGALSPAEIARRLGERFRLLGGGPRRAHERHRTLFAALSWSHDLLTDEEQAVFRRLAVFPASFDVDAGEAVAGSNGPSVACLIRLVERSLVQFDPKDGRYRLLETLRQYGADRLADAGETDAAQERHARYFLGLVARQAGALAGPGYPEARAVLTAELDNLRTLAEWCAEHGRWAELLAMCRQMLVFAHLSRPETAPWYRQVLDGDAALEGQDRVDALGELAYFTAQDLGDWAVGAALAAESDDVCAGQCLAPSPWAGQGRAMVALYTGRHDDALQASRAALEAAESRHDEFAAVTALAVVGYALTFTDVDDAGPVTLDALARAERMGNPVVTANGAIVASAKHLLTSGGPDFAASLAVLTRYASDFSAGDSTAMWSHLFHGYDLLGLGEPGAVEHVADAFRLADRLNAPHVVDRALRILAVLAADAGHTRDAATLVGYADTNPFGDVRIRDPGWTWVQDRIDNALAGPDLSVERARGAALTRGDVVALVGDLEAALRAPDPA
jgi:predicted ATPase